MTDAFQLEPALDLLTTSGADVDSKLQASARALRTLEADAVPAMIANLIYQDATSSPKKLRRRNAANAATIDLFPDLDAANGGLLAASGASMTGALAMGGSKITGLGAPTAGTDASTKQYVDDVDTRVKKLQVAIPIPDGMPASGTTDFMLFATELAITILSASVTFNAAQAASDTNYYDFRIRNTTAANDVTNAQTTKVTGGAAVSSKVRYALGSIANGTISANALLEFRCIVTGSPAGLLTAKAVVTIEYQNT